MGLINNWRARALVIVTATAFLTACLGGGGGGGPQSTTLSGVAAEGAPMAGATVQLVDASGAVVATATAGEDGSYTLTVPSTAQAPFVASATRDELVYYAPVAENKTGTINITKITNLIAAQLSPTGDPADLAEQIKAGAATVSPETVREVVAAVVEALAPLLANVGDAVDPLTGSFAADGTGHDQVLKALDITINPAGSSSNITITVKAVTALDQQPPAVSFTSGTKPPPLPQAVATAELPSSDTDALVAAFLAQIQSCYALPVSQRVDGTQVIAPTCREVFSQNDPSTFKQNGATVGPNQAFAGLFRESSTGVTFTNPIIEFLNPGGRLLLSWKNTATNGSTSYSRVWMVRESGALKAIGNQATYPFQVRVWAERRELLNTPTLDYWASGFDVGLANLTDTNGDPVFDRVVVTTPNARKLTLKPNGALSFLTIMRNDGSLSGTSVSRLAGEFVTAGTSGEPRQVLENIFWAANPAGQNSDWTDAEIAAINTVGRWKAEFFLAGNAGTTPDAVQYHETSARPFTIAELKQRTWAGLQAGARSNLVGESSATGYIQMAEGERIELNVDGGDFWTVPAGAFAPTFVQAQGTAGAARFNDNTNVSSTARTAVINCTRQNAGDMHCVGDTGTYSGDSRVNFLQVFAYDQKDVEWVSSFGVYKTTIAP